MAEQLDLISPSDIEPNPENPRQIFDEAKMEQLAESIDQKGILVPLYVYRTPKRDNHYTLIDGERRWQLATRLGLKRVPAIVRDDPPDPTRNLTEMFHIHQVRAEWEEMPTARALQKVMERLGTDDADELKRETGVSKEQIRRYKLILDLPDRYQKMIWNGEVPMNFFVELDDNVLRPLSRRRSSLASEFPPDTLRDAFLAKREANTLPDIIELRQVKPIIVRAAEDAGGPGDPSDFDDVLRTLFLEPAVSVIDAYENSVAMFVETENLAQQVRALPGQLDRLIERIESPDERDALLEVLDEAIDALSARRDRLAQLIS